MSLFPFPTSSDYLKDRIPSNDKRYPSFKLVLDLFTRLQPNILIETGTARYGADEFLGDGGSTIIFGEWAQDNHSILYSIDIDPKAINRSKKAVGNIQNINFICQDSISYLEQFNLPVDFLYLDSFDFDSNNPSPSQEHHLKEIIAIYPKLVDKTLVMIDDCDLPHGGKGHLVIPFLLERKWKIVFKGYQVILSRA